MKRIVLVICSLLAFNHIALHAKPVDDKDSIYFNTAFIDRQHDVLRDHMINDGFLHDRFITKDGYDLSCLYYQVDTPKKPAKATIIFFSGFFPGRKEGLATFFKLLPQEYNLLFFDARGHGESTGSIVASAALYGLYEYRDLLGAIVYAQKKSKAPIIIYGTCSGAFHSANALLRLSEEPSIDPSRIKGLIFDSGWASITEATYHTPRSLITQWILGLFIKKIPSSITDEVERRTAIKRAREEAKNNLLFRSINGALSLPLYLIHKCIALPWYASFAHFSSLHGRISKLQVPIFFIHSLDDTYAPIKDVISLCKEIKQAGKYNPRMWCIFEPSKHAAHYFKFQDLYKKYMLAFIDEILATPKQPTSSK